MPFDKPNWHRLAPGSTIVFSSDGLFEQMNARHERFDGALEPTAIAAQRGAKGRRDAILAQFDAFSGGENLTDDVTLVVVHVPEQN
jgi:serine phosphatase RsbU (regulator of sigma subunit)